MSGFESGYQTGLIGGGVGAAVALFVVLRAAQWPKKLVEKLDAGDAAGARKLLAKHAPPVKPTKSFSNMKLLPQRARLLGLWLLGEVDEVRAELRMHGGGTAYLANVQMFGLLALATEPDADAAAVVAELDDTVRTIQGGSALQKLLKDYAVMIANLGGGLAGRPVDPALLGKLISKIGGETVLTKIVVARAIVVAADRAGKPSLEWQRRLAALTRRWTPAAARAA